MVCPGGQKSLSRGSTMSQMSVQGVTNVRPGGHKCPSRGVTNVRPGGQQCLKCPSRGSQQHLKMFVQGVNNVSNVRPGGLNNVSKCPSRGSTMSQNVHPGDLYDLSGDQSQTEIPGGGSN